MDKSSVASILDEMATLLELQGANPFKARAFQTAARAVRGISGDLAALVESGELKAVHGIGQTTGRIVQDLVKTGTSSDYEQLRAAVPRGLLDMLRLGGLGPGRVKQLYDELHISSVDELEKAIQEKRLSSIKGLGAKTQEKILKNIAMAREQGNMLLTSEADMIARALLEWLAAIPGVHATSEAGSLRRRNEVVRDINLVAAADRKHKAAVLDALAGYPLIASIPERSPSTITFQLRSGAQGTLHVVDPDAYPFSLQYLTGSKEHNAALRERAHHQGMNLTDLGLEPLAGAKTGKKGKPASAKNVADERSLYSVLGLQYIPPELRENRGEIKAAAEGRIPDLVEVQELRGTLHCHTTYSDGLHTLEQMAHGAEEQGWEYLGIADHSKAAAYAGGLTLDDVHRQFREIDDLNGSLRVRLLKGTECDILADGSLDWPDAVLQEFEYVVASVHSNFRMTEADMTARIVKALKNPHVTLLGHPTGRLLLAREAYPVAMETVIDAAADYGKMIEINAHPNRLDLDWRLCRRAKEKGVLLWINPDAHSVEELKHVRYGVDVARKGWLRAEDIANTRDRNAVVELLRRKR